MKKIAIIGPTNCFTKKQVLKQMLFKMKQHVSSHEFLIVSGGNLDGIENDVRNIALDFGLQYKEFTPAYFEQNQYSIQGKEYFGKSYHYSYIVDKYQRILRFADVIIFGADEQSNIDPIYNTILKAAAKKNKKIVFI